MPGKIDFHVEIHASNRFVGLPLDVDKLTGCEAYFSARRVRDPGRKLLSGICGSSLGVANSNLDTIRSQILATLQQAAGGSFANIGQFCLFGSSNGSSLALSLAAALTQRQVRLTYVCLADVPMFPGGRDIPVPDIGACKTDEPSVSLGARAAAVAVGPVVTSIVGRQMPQVDDVPTIVVNSPVVGDLLENYFQTRGNHIKPKATAMNYVWRWASSMGGDEVHGRLPGRWDNIPLNAIAVGSAGATDDGFHNDLCGHVLNKVWPAKAAEALARF